MDRKSANRNLDSYMHRPARRRNYRRINVWLAIGVAVLIILLFFWLTWADLLGDTDVNAAFPVLSAL